jgi:glycosyltransferase involved in cell wall biosynthesis
MATLAHGRALITTKPTSATPELKHGENVWFVPAAAEQDLTAAIQTLLADAELRKRLGAGATAVADLFTWDKIAAQTMTFFERVTAVA